MRKLFLVAVIAALAWARPETYKETEDFQYSRSATDEGTKTGFYGAQRGNVGGNYERAHNMDSLAQHQMSGAVHQVEGELGDASKTKAGSVYTAANSRGIYGSGNFDLSNLEGRNFAESVSSDSSHSSLSSAFNQHSQNSGWRNQNRRFTGSGASDQFGQSSLHSGSLQARNSASSIDSHSSNSENQHGFSSGYHTQSGYNSESRYQGESDSAYNQRLSNAHLSSGYGAQAGDQTQSRYVVTPVRIYGRPGTQVAIPVFAQSSNTHRASAFDQNAINSEAEVFNNNQQHISSVPESNAKHYESSYNYRKAWERHSESNPSGVPSVAPTVNPFPANSELYDAQVGSASNRLQQANSHSFSSGNDYNAQSSIAHSGSTQSRHQTDYSSQHKSDINSNAYLSGTHGSLTGASIGTDVDSQPKSYQSSYSYHKSWERQGDPYVIVPETKTGVSSSQRHSSQYRQSNQHHSQGSAYDCNCDEYGNVRAKRSYNNFQYQEDLGQQAQTGWEENLGQQTQQSWGNFQQQTQPDQLEDLGQQTQESWGDFQQQNKPEKLEDLGQQTQQSWGDLQQQSKPEKLEDLGQQTQQSWGDLQQQSKPEKLEDLGQQTQQSWGDLQQQSKPEKLEDLGQQTQQSWGDLQPQSKPEKLEELGQQSQDWHGQSQQTENHLGQQIQQTWDQSKQHVNSQNLEEFGHHDNQQSQQTFDDLENLGQQPKSKWDFFDPSPLQKQHVLDQPDNSEQQNKPESVEDLGQQTQNEWDNIKNLGQQVQAQWDDTNNINKTQHLDTINTEQQTQTHFLGGNQNKQDKELTEDSWNTQHITGYTDSSQGANWQEQINRNTLQTSSHNPLQSLWDKIDNLEEQTILSANDRDKFSEGFAGYDNSQHSYYAQGSTNHHESSSEQTSNSYYHNQYETNYSGSQPTATFDGIRSTSDKSKNEKSNSEGSLEKPKDKVSTNKLQPTDIGRGDISAEEDSPSDVNIPKKEDDSQTYSTHIKPEKTPDEIEALSLSRGTENEKPKNKNQEDTLSVLSIGQQQWLEDQRQQESNDFHKFRGSSTTKKPNINENSRNNPELSTNSDDNSQDRTNSNFSDHKNQQVYTESKHTFENTEEINQQQQFKDFDQQIQNSDLQNSKKENRNSFGRELEDLDQQQNTKQQLDDFGQKNQDLELFGNHRANIDQHKTDQELEDFGQQSQDFNQQNLQQFEKLDHQSQHSGHKFEDFEQQTQDLNQQNLESFGSLEHHRQKIDQQNAGQELEDFRQQTQNFNQQNLQQFENLEHQSQHSDQQLKDFRQQTQDVNQQNLQSFGHLEHHRQKIDQQNGGQEREDFGQQSQDLNQQNLQQFEKLDHQSQHSGHKFEDFGQQTQDLNQQNLESFGNLEHPKQKIDEQNTGQQLEDFGQQSKDLNQQSLQQFENLDQQSQNLEQEKTWEQIGDLKPLSQIPMNVGKYNHQGRENDPKSNTQEIQEPISTNKEISKSQSVPENEAEMPPQVTSTTEKPGFWKSVGNKLSSAKDSVASWFKRS
ncbi:uncharacterized protein [Choristoneura fumiferana]|uniref:uncharacterized protein n=1 Tax=Choristoneura fumiferana TaxID=7141 RepID=UPI003D15E961